MFDGRTADLNIELGIYNVLDAHAAKQFKHRGDIIKMRQIANLNGVSGQQGCCKDRQRRVFCPSNPYLTPQADSALY